MISTRNDPVMNKVLQLLNDNLTDQELDHLADLLDSGTDDLYVDVPALNAKRNPQYY